MPSRRWGPFSFLVCLTALLAACATTDHRAAAPLAGHAQIIGAAKDNFTPEQRRAVISSAQARLIAQCDSVIARVGQSADVILRANNKDPDICSSAVALKVHIAGSVINIASQSEPDVGLLNLTVVLTLENAVFHALQPDGRTYAETTYGKNSQLLSDTLDDLQKKSWKIDADYYSAAQLNSLRTYLAGWQARHPDAREVADVRLDALVDTQAQASAGQGGSTGFAMMVQIDEATRAVDEVRHLGERALFIAQRYPTFLRWQAELLTLDMALQPSARRTLAALDEANANVTKITPDLQHFLTGVPATLDKLQGQLQTLQTNLPETLKQTQPLLDKVQLTTADLRASLQTIDDISKRFAPAPGAATQPAGEPFSIAHYTQAAAQLATTAQALRELVESSNKMLETAAWKARFQDLDGLTKSRIQEIDQITQARTDGIFIRCIEGLLIFFACLLGYRVIAVKLLRATPPQARP